FDDMPTIVASMREGAADFVAKPLDLHDLRRVLARVGDDRRTPPRDRASGEDEASGLRLEELIGRDPKMIATYKAVGQAASVRTNVLIRGESSTGKELISRDIRQHDAQ